MKYVLCLLLFSCEWNSKDCNDDHITQEITDHGVCYTFNGQTDETVSKTGQ